MEIFVIISILAGLYLTFVGLKIIFLKKTLTRLKEKKSILWTFFERTDAEIHPLTIRLIGMPLFILLGLFFVLNGLCFFFPDLGYCSTTFFETVAW